MSPTPDTERMELVAREIVEKHQHSVNGYRHVLSDTRWQPDRQHVITLLGMYDELKNATPSRPEPQAPESQWLANIERDAAEVSAAEVEFFRELKAQSPESKRRYPGDPEISRAEHLADHLSVHQQPVAWLVERADSTGDKTGSKHFAHTRADAERYEKAWHFVTPLYATPRETRQVTEEMARALASLERTADALDTNHRMTGTAYLIRENVAVINAALAVGAINSTGKAE